MKLNKLNFKDLEARDIDAIKHVIKFIVFLIVCFSMLLYVYGVV